MLLHRSPANEILYGGAAGPGKSHALRMEALVWCLRVPKLKAYLFRRTFPELESNHILQIADMFPKELGKYKEQKRRFEFVNGSILHFCHAQHEADIQQYQGAEIHLLIIDELTTFTMFQYDYLRARCRCALKVPSQYRHKIPGIICASNPGGVGHHFCKQRWVDSAKPYQCWRTPKNEGGMLRQYIPGLLEDNTILMETDPGYISRLDALPEPFRTAYRDGDWDIFLGQAFSFSRKHHICDPVPIPDSAEIYMTFDWGFAKPYSVGYWWTDPDGRAYRCAEIYGCLRGQPDTGLRHTDDDIAERICDLEKKMGISDTKTVAGQTVLIQKRRITRLADPTCFNKKPDYRGGGQGPATSQIFLAHGIKLLPGDPDRLLKIRAFHSRLRIPDTGEKPMMQVYDTCKDFIRTIPLLQNDPNHPEDVDTRMEDHIYDEACHICMYLNPHNKLFPPLGDGSGR